MRIIFSLDWFLLHFLSSDYFNIINLNIMVNFIRRIPIPSTVQNTLSEHGFPYISTRVAVCAFNKTVQENLQVFIYVILRKRVSISKDGGKTFWVFPRIVLPYLIPRTEETGTYTITELNLNIKGYSWTCLEVYWHFCLFKPFEKISPQNLIVGVIHCIGQTENFWNSGSRSSLCGTEFKWSLNMGTYI